ncbi:hypothetical protein HFRIS_020000 [Herbaspirillum frisingense GSF30]|uniref:Uncharacterized protein n=1 Tax=Herbaspirillum frisingense GSF30 TaxID=864073 RepID=A0AAI9N218_9BURK|nr:hypothetical protein [Herbaspirillum frisingense]EOA02930.1 hypothetical protein HFRIS_020000 [Herbaspirillum frisingense GSF30]
MMRAFNDWQSLLTEYDDSVSSDMNVDPLGMLVIWSAYGQKIFRNRISSISNDVRNFTINLFNHAVIRQVMEDDDIALAAALLREKDYAGYGKQALPFRQACLVYLENLYAFSMVAAEARPIPGLATGGVLGIAKARRDWRAHDNNPELLFSHRKEAHVLVRQHSLGISGRYKTPLVQMGFFDHRYDSRAANCQALWDKVETMLFGRWPALAALKKMAVMHLKEVVATPNAPPRIRLDAIPRALRNSFVATFRSPQAVGQHARDFWLEVSELNRGAAGALYAVLQQEWRVDGTSDAGRKPAEIFAEARKMPGFGAAAQAQLEHVMLLEPLLGELDLLMTIMLSAKSQTLDDVERQWRHAGRNAQTLQRISAPVAANAAMLAEASGTTAARLRKLLALAGEVTLHDQVRHLLTYHEEVMQARRQSPWLRLSARQELKSDVGVRTVPDQVAPPGTRWVHRYYLPQFRVLLAGLRGEEHEAA